MQLSDIVYIVHVACHQHFITKKSHESLLVVCLSYDLHIEPFLYLLAVTYLCALFKKIKDEKV